MEIKHEGKVWFLEWTGHRKANIGWGKKWLYISGRKIRNIVTNSTIIDL
jgi:hypothetical protein